MLLRKRLSPKLELARVAGALIMLLASKIMLRVVPQKYHVFLAIELGILVILFIVYARRKAAANGGKFSLGATRRDDA